MRKTFSRIVIGCSAALLVPNAEAGGLITIDGAQFGATSNQITNPWALMPAGTRFTSFA